MRNPSFGKKVLGRGLMIAGLGIALLVVGVTQAQAQNSVNQTLQVTNLLCGINGDAGFEVVAISSTDQCVLFDVALGEDCSEALQFIMGSRRFGISAGGGGVSQGISEALVTTAGGIVYTLTRRPVASRRDRLEECVAAD